IVITSSLFLLIFFFQAEDGIRDFHVTGVQTCALPILTQLNKADFIEHLDYWLLTHEDYLSERSTNEDTGRSWYTHKRLRSAYRSLRTNNDWLFTYQEYEHLDIPNTTNSLEGLFSELKRQLHSHHGLNEQRKLRFIKDFLGSKSLK